MVSVRIRGHAVRPAAVLAIAAALLSVVGLAMMAGSSERTVLAPMYMLEGFEPWKAAPWDDRTGQEPGEGGAWYDQAGAFYGPGGIAQRGEMVRLKQGGAAREQQLYSRGYGYEGLNRDQRESDKLSSYANQFESQGELAQIVSPISANSAENEYRSESRHAAHHPLARASRTQALHMWDAGAMQSLPDKLRRREKLDDLKEMNQRGGDMAAIFGARAARLQGLHEWDAGRVQELPLQLRRKEKLMDMRENSARAAETAGIFGSNARAARLQGLHMWDAASWQSLPDHLSRQEKLDDMKELNQRGGDMAAIFGRSNARAARLQSLSQLNQGGQSSYRVERQETLSYMHDQDQINDEMGDINGPLDEDEHKMGLKGQHTQMLHADIMQAFNEAKGDSSKRAALKQRLTMLCDEGRSHPQYWALKTELDRLDGGEDDSDTVQAYDDDGMAGLRDTDSF